MKSLLIRCGLVLGLCHSLAQAELRVSELFSDHAVLQQGMTVPIWGWADDGERVTVKFRGQTVHATAQYGQWSVKLKKLKPGGPDVLTIATKTRSLRFTNVLVGEVWVCSGQSNMEWPLHQTAEGAAAIPLATNTQIRFFNVPNLKSDAPTTRLNSRWEVCSPEVARHRTAVGYHFGKKLQAERGVPIGLIQSDWGGSPAEVWMSRAFLEMRPGLQTEILDGYNEAMRRHREATIAYELEKAEAVKAGQEFRKPGPWQPWKPSELYQGMIAPLLPYAMRGAIWYQGESNAGRAEQYRTLFADLIRNWRSDWGQGDFPFLLVQLAPFMEIKEQPAESDWAELREAQWLATKTLPKVGMAVITDVGDPKDIHPQQKQPVGERLALAAQAIAYGEKITYSGPEYQRMEQRDDKIVLHFNHVGAGLEARHGALKGFAICGADRKFVWANAEIVGKTVVVSSPEVTQPIAVRYGWADCPVVNLWNKDGLPATPFRTDDFPMITAGKR
jgi:sialate O-acetylesterase